MPRLGIFGISYAFNNGTDIHMHGNDDAIIGELGI